MSAKEPLIAAATACGCGHTWAQHRVYDRNQPCGWCDCPKFTRGVQR